MKFRTMLVLGLAPTCVRCDRAFPATPASPFYCQGCQAAPGSVEEQYRRCMGDAVRNFPRFRLVLYGNPRQARLARSSSVKSVQSVSPLPLPTPK